jgi:hypothetical protein
MQRGLVMIAVGILMISFGGCGGSSGSDSGTVTRSTISHLGSAPVRADHKAERKARHRAKEARAKARHQARVRARHEAARRRARHRHQLHVRQEHQEAKERRQVAAIEARERRAAEKEEAVAAEASECDPNYSGACLDPYSSDYDCEGGSGNGPDYTGEVTVVGVDHYDLDADGDGIGCEP